MISQYLTRLNNFYHWAFATNNHIILLLCIGAIIGGTVGGVGYLIYERHEPWFDGKYDVGEIVLFVVAGMAIGSIGVFFVPVLVPIVMLFMVPMGITLGVAVILDSASKRPHRERHSEESPR